jgi:hypothetical protein
MLRPRLPVRTIAALLALLLTCTSPLAAIASSTDNARALALANADATKAKALSRLDTEVTSISQKDQKLFAERMNAAIDNELKTLRRSYDKASTYLEGQIGYSTPWLATFQSLWNGEEQAQRVFQEKIDAAVAHANLPAQREKVGVAIEAALLENATAQYQAYRATFNTILYETIGETGGLGRLTKDLVKDLIARIDATSRELAVKDGVVDARAVTSLPTGAMAVLSAILAARIAQSVMSAMGTRTAANVIGTRIVSLFLGPVGWIVLGGATIRDIWNAKANALEECNKVLWQSYHDMSRSLTDPGFMSNITKATVAGLEQQLETDRRAARIEMDRYFRGMLVQARSPGYEQFVEGRNQKDALRGFQQVAAAFGEDLVDVPFATKYELTSDIPPEKSGPMIQKYGQTFVDLYTQDRKAVTEVMRNPRHAEIMLDVTQSEKPVAALTFYKQNFDRLGSLEAQQTDALILIRQLHPGKRPDEINKDALTILGESAGRLATFKTQNPEAVATLVDWVLQGQLSSTLMQRLTRHGSAALLLSLPLYLGPDAMPALLAAASEDTLVQFVKDFSRPGTPLASSQAIALLREDGPGHLKAYAAPSGGGAHAVIARHTLLQEYGGKLPPDADSTVHWILANTSVDATAIHKSTIDNLRALGIPGGVIPRVLAIPTAVMVASTGLVGPILAVLVFLGGTGLAISRFVFRLPLPFSRRRPLPAEPVRPMIDVTGLPRRKS